MDGTDVLGAIPDIVVGSRSRGRVPRAKWVGEPHSQVGKSALLSGVTISVLANLAGIVRPCAAGVTLHFDHRLPFGDALKCKAQVFTFSRLRKNGFGHFDVVG